MAIEDILQTLDEQAQADCEAVIQEAREHAKLILDEATRGAQEANRVFVKQAERSAEADAARRVNAARLAGKMEVSSAKGDAVRSVFEGAGTRLSTLRSMEYDSVFDALAAEALAGAGGEVAIHVVADDVDRARRATHAAGIEAEVVGDLETAGGLIVEAFGGRVIRRNTFESRLERVSHSMRADVARVLFS